MQTFAPPPRLLHCFRRKPKTPSLTIQADGRAPQRGIESFTISARPTPWFRPESSQRIAATGARTRDCAFNSWGMAGMAKVTIRVVNGRSAAQIHHIHEIGP